MKHPHEKKGRRRLNPSPKSSVTVTSRISTPVDGMDLWLARMDYSSGERLHSNGKWPFIVDVPIKNGDFPLLC